MRPAVALTELTRVLHARSRQISITPATDPAGRRHSNVGRRVVTRTVEDGETSLGSSTHWAPARRYPSTQETSHAPA